MAEKYKIFCDNKSSWKVLSWARVSRMKLMGLFGLGSPPLLALALIGLLTGGFAAQSLSPSQEPSDLCAPEELEIQGWGLCFHYDYLEGPYVNPRGERRFSSGEAHIYSPQGRALESEPYFYLWMKMPHNHEHGGRPLKIQSLRQGIFQIEEMLLMKMPGQWFLRLNVQGPPQDPAQDYHAEWPLTDWE